MLDKSRWVWTTTTTTIINDWQIRKNQLHRRLGPSLLQLIKRTLHYLVYTTDYLWQFLIIFSPLWLQTEESIFHAARMLLQSFDWIYSRLYFVNYFLFRAYQRGDFPLVLSHTGRGCKLVWKVSIFFLLFLVNSEQILQGHKIFIIIADL